MDFRLDLEQHAIGGLTRLRTVVVACPPLYEPDTTMKKSMLYLMHVDWGWAKQRPHFVAEGLARYYDVSVRFVQSFNRKLVSKGDQNDRVDIGGIFRFPLARFAAVRALNALTAQLQLHPQVRSSSIVWVTHPNMFDLVRQSLRAEAVLIYDCMDDVLEFPDTRHDPAKREAMARLEGALAARADVVFASSRYLKAKLRDRYGIGDDRLHVVNNGINLAPRAAAQATNAAVPLRDLLGPAADAVGKRMVYIGTISEWFDFDIVLRTLEERDDISYVIVGPREIDPPTHPRLFVVPPVAHHEVARIMDWADALIMPFRLTELIRSVNPVKVYEYIRAGKPAVVLRYGETEVFEPYVHLYATAQEYSQIVAQIAQGSLPKLSNRAAAKRFVEGSSWTARVDALMTKIPVR
ncbi:glycosyltransferase [Sphingomonas sp. RS2018]